MTELTLPAAWTEETFERGTYGPDERPGVRATFEAASGDAAVEVSPVRYARRDGRDEFGGRVDEFEHRSGTVAIRGPTEIAPRTAFAVRARFAPRTREREVVYAAPADADDALAVAALLARECPDGAALGDAVETHGGAGGGSPALSDDEVLDARLAETAERCLFDGVPTNSHVLSLPLRLAVATDGYPHTDAGLPRVPTLVARFEALVSHEAWEREGLADLDPTAPVERRGPGEYVLPDADALAAGSADRLALFRHGEAED